MSTPKDVRDVVVSAYYARVMTSSDTARARAQAAYGIASAIAAAVVAAGLFGNLGERPAGVQVVAVAALIAWLIAAALFLHTVSSPFDIGLQPQIDEEAFISAALEAIRKERARIDAWQRRAQLASAVAALVTVIAFIAALRTDHAQTQATATVTVTAAGAATLKAACGRVPAVLIGKASETSLREQFIELTLEPGVCGPSSVDVAIRRSEVLALAFRQPLAR
jgi:Na+/melibiose symporter-like transporter